MVRFFLLASKTCSHSLYIGLFSTGETTLKGNEDKILEGITSAPNAIAKRILENFPIKNRYGVFLPLFLLFTLSSSGQILPEWEKRKKELLEELEAMELPKNPLDDLTDKLGGPSKVGFCFP